MWQGLHTIAFHKAKPGSISDNDASFADELIAINVDFEQENNITMTHVHDP